MKNIILILLLSQLILSPVKAQIQLNNVKDTTSYSLGVLVAGNLKQQGLGDINVDMFAMAMKAALNGEQTLLSPDQCQEYVMAVANKQNSKNFEANRKAGEDYLAQNKLRKEVTTLADGLQYEVMKAGDGPKPKASDKVKVHYHGTLIDGTVFDSSVDRGEPISFSLNQVIKGWSEILQLMPVGSKWRVYIPYALAYGERSAGPEIQPYSTLIFEIELLGIE